MDTGCFHVLSVVNSAVTNIRVHVSFRIMFFSRYMPRSGIAGSYMVALFFLFFFFLGKLLFKRTGQINSKNHNVKVPSMSKIVLKNYKEKQNCREALCAISIKT